jgi:hypothetical protein
MKKIALLVCFFCALAQASESGDFVRFQYDYLNFTNSKQKDYGSRGTLHLKSSFDDKTLQLAYEKTITETYKPPLKSNLNVDKLIARYDQKLFDHGRYNLGLIMVKDNLVPTDGGKVFNLGYMHRLTPDAALEGNIYYGHYDIMKTYQFDAALKLHKKIGSVDTLLVGLLKDIVVDECSDVFCANAKSNYLTAGVKVKLDYNGYFLHAGGFYGKRAFAVMMEGFMLQHHAMEFDRTYMAGIGKRFEDIELKVRYVHQRAKELPLNNSGVDVDAMSLRVAYFF